MSGEAQENYNQVETAEFFTSAQDLSTAAELISRNAKEHYQRSVYLYFIARFMVSLHEATVGSIPTQVWSEYRNALDHHMRYLSLPDDTDHRQIKSMEGHLQRAVLDVCKLFAHRTLDILEGSIKQDTLEVLRMVNSGHFYEVIRTGIDNIQTHFAKVKTCDANLGNESSTDRQILEAYLEVAFESWKLVCIYREARHDIEVAAAQRREIQDHATADAIAQIHEPLHNKLIEHVLGHIIFYLLVALVGVGSTLYLLR